MYSREELSTFSLQRLASLFTGDLAQEELIKEVFEIRASVSDYFTLSNVVDIRHKWQEEIVQKYLDIKRENMPPEYPAKLTPSEEADLDTNRITKEKELELQAKIDARNNTRRSRARSTPKEKVAAEEIETVSELPAPSLEGVSTEVTPVIDMPSEQSEAAPELAKRGRKAKAS